MSFLALYRDDFEGWAKLVIDSATNTLLGATFVGPQFSELVQAATLAIVAKVPISLLRHAVAPHPKVNQVWDPLPAQETELAHRRRSKAANGFEQDLDQPVNQMTGVDIGDRLGDKE